MKYSIIIAICMLTFIAADAQGKRHKEIKDSLTSLGCPMLKGVMQSATQDGAGYKGDLKMTITSKDDTLVLSPVDGKVDLLTMGDGGRYEVVMHHGDYNIWLTGISRLLVKKGDVLKKGQAIGRVTPGEEIEILLFNDEEPIDPKKYLDCLTK